jgi:hypothetical protein
MLRWIKVRSFKSLDTFLRQRNDRSAYLSDRSASHFFPLDKTFHRPASDSEDGGGEIGAHSRRHDFKYLTLLRYSNSAVCQLSAVCGTSYRLADDASDRPSPHSIGEPPASLGLGDTCTTRRRLRAGRLATVEAATRLARLRSDLAAAAGPSLCSAKEPTLTPVWRRLVG